jgi:hypothetical protein
MFLYIKNKYNKLPNFVIEPFKKEVNFLYMKVYTSPYMYIPKTEDEFYALHKSKFWYTIKKKIRKYEEAYGDMIFKKVIDIDEQDIILDQCFELYNKKWEGYYSQSLWKEYSSFKSYKEAMYELSKNSKASLYVLLDKNDNLLSYAYCLNDDKKFYFYQHTSSIDIKYRKFSLGKILIYKILLDIINNNNYEIFDFMIGEHPYKMEWAKKTKNVYLKIPKNFKGYIKYAIKYLQLNIKKYPLIFNTLKKILYYLKK